MYLKILLLKVLINLSATTDFPSLCVECVPILLFLFQYYFYMNHFLKELLKNSLPLFTHILFGFLLEYNCIESSKIS